MKSRPGRKVSTIFVDLPAEQDSQDAGNTGLFLVGLVVIILDSFRTASLDNLCAGTVERPRQEGKHRSVKACCIGSYA